MQVHASVLGSPDGTLCRMRMHAMQNSKHDSNYHKQMIECTLLFLRTQQHQREMVCDEEVAGLVFWLRQWPSGRGRQSTCRPCRRCNCHLHELKSCHISNTLHFLVSASCCSACDSPQVHWPEAHAEQPPWPDEGHVLHSQSFAHWQLGPAISSTSIANFTTGPQL